jgi:hypothetical protein
MGQLLINAVTGEVKSRKIHMSSNATYQELVYGNSSGPQLF